MAMPFRLLLLFLILFLLYIVVVVVVVILFFADRPAGSLNDSYLEAQWHHLSSIADYTKEMREREETKKSGQHRNNSI